MTVTVLGAGVVGLCVATVLAQRGIAIEVIDSAPNPRGASWLAGGMLAPHCEGENAPDQVVALGSGAADWWDAHFDQVSRNGTLVVAPARDRAELDRFAARITGYQRVDAKQIGELEPDLGGRFNAGLFVANEAHLDPRQALLGLIEGLRRKGVPVRFATSKEPSGQIVDCRGLAARDQLTDLRAVRGEMLLLRSDEIALARPVRLLHPRFPVYIVPRDHGHFMVGATMIESDHGGAITARSAMELLSAAYALHPAFGEAEIVETAAGLRPAFADNLPAIRKAGDRIHVNGFYRHGFLLAPAFAQRLAENHFQNREVRHAS